MAKTFPILYSRTTTGATQRWQIFVEGGAYWTEAGQLSGQLTKSAPTIAKPKNVNRANATSAEEQAVAEAQAKWDKKKKLGYFEDINDIDKILFIEPMLAQPLHKLTKPIHFPAILQVKFNGARCIITKEGMRSRKGEAFLSCPHIFEELKPLFAANPGLVIDGELFNNDLRERLCEIMSLIRKTVDVTQEDLDKSRKLIRFYAYDGWGLENTTEETPYSIRKALIDQLHKTYQYIAPVRDFIVKNQEDIDKHYAAFVADKQEGAILRYPESPYERKRSKNLVKIKPTDDAEYLVTGISEGDGNWAGMAKIIHLKRIDGGKFLDGTDTFDASFKGSMAEAKQVLHNPQKYIGKVFTIYYNGYTGYGKPNYAQFDINNCLKS